MLLIGRAAQALCRWRSWAARHRVGGPKSWSGHTDARVQADTEAMLCRTCWPSSHAVSCRCLQAVQVMLLQHQALRHWHRHTRRRIEDQQVASAVLITHRQYLLARSLYTWRASWARVLRVRLVRTRAASSHTRSALRSWLRVWHRRRAARVSSTTPPSCTHQACPDLPPPLNVAAPPLSRRWRRPCRRRWSGQPCCSGKKRCSSGEQRYGMCHVAPCLPSPPPACCSEGSLWLLLCVGSMFSCGGRPAGADGRCGTGGPSSRPRSSGRRGRLFRSVPSGELHVWVEVGRRSEPNRLLGA